MKLVLTITLIGLVLGCFTEVKAGKGGFEAEVGDVQEDEHEPYLSTGNFPFLQHRGQSLNSKQPETENSRLKLLDEKLRKAEEEGNRLPVQGTGTGSDSSGPKMIPGSAKP